MKTVIEAGHFYACTGPTNVSMQGWHIGQELAMEQPSALALFVDDYHPATSFAMTGEESAPVGTADQLIHEADHVFYESAFAADSPKAIQQLLELGKVKLKRGVVSAGGIRLGAFSEDEFLPTCTLMDYLLLCEKVAFGGDQVTVLPDAYEPQQSGLMVVANKLAVTGLSSYAAKLFNTEGTVSKEIAL